MATNLFMLENLAAQLPIPGVLRPLVWRWAWRDVGRVYERASVVMCPTKRAVDLLEHWTPLRGVRPQSCGIDVDHFGTTGRSRQRDGDDPPTVLFVGRLEREKCVDELIDAFARPAPAGARLELVGDGTMRAAWERRVQHLGLGERVLFRGFVDDDALVQAYANCDIFCIPAVAELQSLVTLEAMCAGKPVVAADAVALPHLVRPENGLLYQPGDIDELAGHLVRLANDPLGRARMGRASRTIAADHALAATLDAFEAVYEEVTGERTAAA